jgi:hypothetical protein
MELLGALAGVPLIRLGLAGEAVRAGERNLLPVVLAGRFNFTGVWEVGFDFDNFMRGIAGVGCVRGATGASKNFTSSCSAPSSDRMETLAERGEFAFCTPFVEAVLEWRDKDEP